MTGIDFSHVYLILLACFVVAVTALRLKAATKRWAQMSPEERRLISEKNDYLPPHL
jgi:uncharacterized membrane protein YidH (DUF202 family)